MPFRMEIVLKNDRFLSTGKGYFQTLLFKKYVFQSFDIFFYFCVIEYAYNYITVVLNQSNQEFLNDVHVIIFKKKVVLFKFLVRNIIMTGLMDEIAFYFYFPLT